MLSLVGLRVVPPEEGLGNLSYFLPAQLFSDSIWEIQK